jgi:tripartite-type tricarboxylate transporter receptor subunit TctC
MEPLITRRAALQAAGASACLLPIAGLSATQQLPNVNKLLVGFPAGGSVDAVSRRLGELLRGAVADNVIVDNRPGAGGRMAIDQLRAGPADGNQWLVTPGSMLVIYPHVYRKLSYDPVKDLQPVAQVANVPLVLAVGPAVPAEVRDVPTFVAWAKASPAQANIGTPAAGNITHFLAFLLARSTGIKFQYVPFRGSAPAIQDLIGGQVPAVINPLTEMLPYLQSGKLRVLGVTSRERSKFAPQVPTFIEQGQLTVVGSEWIGVFACAGTPQHLVGRMASAVRAAVQTPAMGAALDTLALERADDGGPQLARRIAGELAGWREVSRVFGFRLDD